MTFDTTTQSGRATLRKSYDFLLKWLHHPWGEKAFDGMRHMQELCEAIPALLDQVDLLESEVAKLKEAVR